MLIFNPRNGYYKSRFGAVTSGTEIEFKLKLPHGLGAFSAGIELWRDGESPRRDFFQMLGADDEGKIFEGAVSFEEPGLYFYRFHCHGHCGDRIITRGRWNDAVLSDGTPYQQTVYRPEQEEPDSSPLINKYGGGVIYQIFPDRFFKGSGKAAKHFPDRYYNENWGGQPAYTQNGEPRSLGNDYFGGTLRGVKEKLPYISGLGVTVIYLNPIFEAHSNHRYNTADYRSIDPDLGTETDFTELCESAHKYGIKIILDGVFSHTGADSVYFNQNGRYSGAGAAQGTASPYYGWYTFRHFPDDYDCWWGVPSLPEVNETDPSFMEFICGGDGVLRRWLRLGADGWRLDVADELPDVFLDAVYSAIKAEKPDALVISEVWEDASNKISHGGRRRFLLGGQTDSVMNYPFYESILDFIRGETVDGREFTAERFVESVLNILENYPKRCADLLMNHLGTHDTARLITLLAGEPVNGRGRPWQSEQTLTPEQYERGSALVKLAAVICYTLPGIPSLYYGDEMGLSGYADPFNRGCMEFETLKGTEKSKNPLRLHYTMLGGLRKNPVFKDGEFVPVYFRGGVLVYARKKDEDVVVVAVNRGETTAAVTLPAEVGGGEISVPPCDFVIKT